MGRQVAAHVQCPECKADSDASLTFCAKCGASLRPAAAPASGAEAGPAAAPSPPTTINDLEDARSRRRLRSAALILVVVGLLGASNAAFALFVPPLPDLETIRETGGIGASGGPGSLHLVVVQAGVPLGGLELNVTEYGASAVQHYTTESDGSVTLTAMPAPLSNVTARRAGETYTLIVFASAPFGADITWDLAEADPGQPRFDATSMASIIRILSGVFLVMSAVVTGGGFAALRRRGKFLAIAGGVVAVLLALFSSGNILFFAVTATASVLALVWIVRARRLFAQGSPPGRTGNT